MSAVAQRFGSGQSVRRIEDPALVAGKGQFTDDVAPAGQTFLSLQRSPYPHARIVAIDTAAALALPGVLAVYTGADLVAAGVKPMSSQPVFPGPGGAPAPQTPRHALAVGEVRFVGEAVVAVVGATADAARAGRDAVVVDYDELPNVVHLDDAIAAGAPKVWADATDNYAAEMRHGNAEACAAAFAQAAHVVALDLVNQRLAPTSLEPRSVLGSFEDGRVTLRMSSQMPSGVRDTLCNEVFGWPTDKLRVVVGDVGGGFGMKTGAYPEDIVVAFCAHTLQRPVKWVSERSEEFLAASHGRDIRSRAELALDASGRVLGLRVHTEANVGAYATTTGVIIQLLIGPWVSTSVYDIQTIDFKLQAVLTNTTPLGAYRGAGRPEAIYIIERLMDTAARKLGLDPAELRKRNMIRPEQMPYTNPMGQTYDSGKFESVQTQALALADWAGFDARAAQSKKDGKLRGRGLASFLEWTGGNVFEERVTVNVSGDGFIEVFSATQAMGQGIATSYAQLVVDVFGVPIEKVRIVQGDTDRGTGFGSAGSRSIFVGGSAVQVASQRTVEKAQNLAAEALETAPKDIEYREGVFRVVGTDRQIGLFDLAAQAERPPGLRRFHQRGAGAELAQRLPHLRGRDRPRHRRGRGGELRVGQRRRPRHQPDHRHRPARRRRGAGPGPGAVRADGLRARIRPAADRHADGLRAAARRHGQELQDRARPEHAVPDQPAGRQGRGRTRHHRRHAGGGERGGRRADARRCR